MGFNSGFKGLKYYYGISGLTELGTEPLLTSVIKCDCYHQNE